MPNNRELALKFLDVMMRTSANHHMLIEQKRRIEECPGSIAEAFALEGSLTSFKIYRLHAKFYPLLESILREGTEACAEKQVADDIASQRRNQFRGLKGSIRSNAPAASPGWENGVRRIEEQGE